MLITYATKMVLTTANPDVLCKKIYPSPIACTLPKQTCAKITKISGILDLQDPGSGILADLGSYIFIFSWVLRDVTTILPWDPRDLGSLAENILMDPGDPGSSSRKLSWDLPDPGS